MTTVAKRINPMASYFVQMRELERQLILGTLAAAKDALAATAAFTDQLHMAARVLGVHATYLRVRARVLGGVFDGDPKREPPTSTAAKVWSEENGAGKTRSPAAKPRAPKPVEEPGPDA